MPLPQRPNLTKSTFKNKGFRCSVCKEWKPIVTQMPNGQACDACLPEGRGSLISREE